MNWLRTWTEYPKSGLVHVKCMNLPINLLYIVIYGLILPNLCIIWYYGLVAVLKFYHPIHLYPLTNLIHTSFDLYFKKKLLNGKGTRSPKSRDRANNVIPPIYEKCDNRSSTIKFKNELRWTLCVLTLLLRSMCWLYCV